MAPVIPRILLLLVLFNIQNPCGVFAACYFPDGALSPNDTPCRDDSTQSTCCGQGYACLTNGICQATGEELVKSKASEFVRGSCTDITWRSANCPLFCMTPGVDNTGGGNGIAKCENTEKDLYWCINGIQGGVDCKEARGVLYFPGTPSAITTIGVSPKTAAATPTSSALVDSTTSNAPQDQNSSPDTAENSSASSPGQGAIIGGALGGAIAILGLGGLGIWLFLRRREKKAPAQTIASDSTVRLSPLTERLNTWVGSDTGFMYGGHSSWKPSTNRASYAVSAIPPPAELPASPFAHR
ncbi:Fc.00g092670.m01.CDS01 [Cosmosporella sp. VM-42]